MVFLMVRPGERDMKGYGKFVRVVKFICGIFFRPQPRDAGIRLDEVAINRIKNETPKDWEP